MTCDLKDNACPSRAITAILASPETSLYSPSIRFMTATIESDGTIRLALAANSPFTHDDIWHDRTELRKSFEKYTWDLFAMNQGNIPDHIPHVVIVPDISRHSCEIVKEALKAFPKYIKNVTVQQVKIPRKLPSPRRCTWRMKSFWKEEILKESWTFMSKFIDNYHNSGRCVLQKRLN